MKFKNRKMKMPNKWKKNLYLNLKYQIKILYNNSKNQLMEFKIRWISLNKISSNLKINNKYLNKINSSKINRNKKISFKTLVKSDF